jgi:hypothetical protein
MESQPAGPPSSNRGEGAPVSGEDSRKLPQLMLRRMSDDA